MKAFTSILLTVALLLSLTACGGGSTADVPEPAAPVTDSTDPAPSVTEPAADEETPSATTPSAPADASADASAQAPAQTTDAVDLSAVTTFEELEACVAQQLADGIASLNAQWEALAAEIDTYDKYVSNTETVTAFYRQIVTATEQLCILLYEDSAAYARMVLDSSMSAEDKYDAMDGLHDLLYEDACDELHDEIYEELLDQMKDSFYDGILDDAEDTVDYSDWYDVCSDEYDQWYDTCSDVYDLYYDTASDIYSFYYDLSRELYSEDNERAEQVYDRFLEKIAKVKGLDTGTTVAAPFDTTLRSADSVAELEPIIAAHVDECTQALWAEWEALAADIDTFDEYLANVETVEAFHTHLEDATLQIFALIREYAAAYAGLILQSGASTDEMYDAFDGFYDCLYEDACELVYDEIYEDLFDEVMDYYYDGIIDDGQDSIPYSDWSDVHGDAYRWWSDTRGEVYSAWSDTRGDLYGFYSDMRGELYQDDLEGASNELQAFSGAATTVAAVEPVETADPVEVAEPIEVAAPVEEPDATGIRPEFQAAMDEYETFFNDYVDFMVAYNASEDTSDLFVDYLSMMSQYADTMEALEAIDESTLSDEEAAYYAEVVLRINQKLLSIL